MKKQNGQRTHHKRKKLFKRTNDRALRDPRVRRRRRRRSLCRSWYRQVEVPRAAERWRNSTEEMREKVGTKKWDNGRNAR